MRKYQKKLVILTTVGALAVGSLSVSAAGLRDVFDAKYYADTYEDLKKAYGYDEEALFNLLSGTLSESSRIKLN